jgi:NADPH:quinone reductase-like Zn-dependent oxidoreductase
VTTRHGGIDVLQVQTGPDPVTQAGQVRIRVKAAGLNFSDIMARVGLYPDAPKPPFVIGYEVSGVIDEVGAGVIGFAVGDRVLALTRFGGQADLICIPAAQVLRMPEGMSFEEGAALPVTYLTAYHMLFHVGAVKPGEMILVHMAAGGVGIAVLQLVKTVPNVTVLGTASASKHDFIRAQGCTHPIDYHTVDYEPEVKRLTNGRGVDMVLDALGGADWKKGYGLLRPAGRLITFGFANMASGGKRNLLRVARQFLSMPRFSPIALMNDNRTVGGVNMGHLWNETELLIGEMQVLLDLYRKGIIKPQVDAVFPFAKAGEAHLRIEGRKNVGKIVLTPE